MGASKNKEPEQANNSQLMFMLTILGSLGICAPGVGGSASAITAGVACPPCPLPAAMRMRWPPRVARGARRFMRAGVLRALACATWMRARPSHGFATHLPACFDQAYIRT